MTARLRRTQSLVRAIMLRRDATKRRQVRVGTVPAWRPTMRVMETLTGSLLSAATVVLAVGAVFAL